MSINQEFHTLLQEVATNAPSLNDLRVQIREHQPNAADDWVDKMAQLLRIYVNLRQYYARYNDRPRSKDIQQEMAVIEKALNFLQHNLIVMIGFSGAGKSTLTNALLGKDLVPTGSLGGATTGAPAYFIQDASNGNEYAEVKYRSDEDVLALVREILKLPATDSRFSSINAQCLDEIENLPAPEGMEDFEEIKKGCIDMIQQAIRNHGVAFQTTFSFNTSADSEKLRELIHENSSLNRDPSRRCIGLIETVVYHVSPNKTLRLPQNIVIVDPPGNDGSPVHDHILQTMIADATAVIVVSPPKFSTGRAKQKLEDAVKYVVLKGSLSSFDRLFFAVNHLDSVNVPVQDLPAQLKKEVANLFKDLGIPANHPYYGISALLAFQSIRLLQGEKVEDSNRYHALKVALGIADQSPEETLEATQVPRLVKDVNQFVSTIQERQPREVGQALRQLIKQEIIELEPIKQELTNGTGDLYIRRRIEQHLTNREKECTDFVRKFTRDCKKQYAQMKESFTKDGEQVGQQIEADLRNNLSPGSSLVAKYVIEDSDLLNNDSYLEVVSVPLLVEINIIVWDGYAKYLLPITEKAANLYEKQYQTLFVAETLSKLSYGFVSPDVVARTINESTAQMRQHLYAAARNLALAKGAQQENQFMQYLPDGEPDFASPLLKEIRKIVINLVSPDSLLSQLRARYQPIINDAIAGMMSLKTYELICIQRSVEQLMSNVFFEMRHAETLPQTIYEAVSDSDVDMCKLEEVNDRLDMLYRMKDALEGV